jgi:hypothetical protein
VLGVFDSVRRLVAPRRLYDSPAPGRVGARGPRRRMGEALGSVTALTAGPKSRGVIALDLGVGALLGGLFGAARARGRREGAAVAAALGLWVLGDEFLVPLVGLSGEPWRYSVAHQLYRMGRRAAFAASVAALYGALLER